MQIFAFVNKKYMDISERIKQIMDHYNLSSAEFSQIVKVQKSSISHLLSGRNKPSFDFINKLAKAFADINIEWFVTGNGNMLKEMGLNDEGIQLNEEKSLKTSDVTNKKTSNGSENIIITETNSTEKSPQKISEPKNDSPTSMLLIFDDDTFKVLQSR